MNHALPRVAIISFPGMNCEIESVRAVRRNGMEACMFRWNDDREKLRDTDAYFLPGGFSYEDRGRAGMVAAHDSLMDFLRGESARGKVIIGNCNGAQILVESGLIPLDRGLQMSLARNVSEGRGVGFLSTWVWIKRTCRKNRCATSDWDGLIHLPIAHGEGRFTTRDPDVMKELKKNDQIAFSYCDATGKVSEEPLVTPNGSMHAIAGLCNPAGNVVALMPHPERTANGDPYFRSLKKWILAKGAFGAPHASRLAEPVLSKAEGLAPQHDTNTTHYSLRTTHSHGVEVFIDTIIVNNEERTTEQLLKKYVPKIRLKQLRYLSLPRGKTPQEVLSHLSLFNPNKEVATIRRKGEKLDILNGICFLRLDEGAQESVCYVCKGVDEKKLETKEILEIFANPQASVLERLL